MATSSSKKKTGTAKKSAPAAKKPASAPKKQPAAKAAPAPAATAPTWPYAIVCIVLSLLAFLGLFHAEGVIIDGFAGFLCGIMGWGFWAFPFAMLLLAWVFVRNPERHFGLRVTAALLIAPLFGTTVHLMLCRVAFTAQTFGAIVGQLYDGGKALTSGGVISGGIIAGATYPNFDLEKYNTDDAYLTQLYADESQPLFNRALNGIFTPGSVFKPLVALAALEEGVITPTSHPVNCDGAYHYYAPDYEPGCLGVHGEVDVYGAIRNSCNAFFFDVGRMLTIHKMHTYAELFALGEKTGCELSESAGIMSDPKTYTERHGANWYDGLTIQAAIGQCDDMFTPIELAEYCAMIANGGTRYKTYFLNKVTDYDRAVEKETAEPEVVLKAEIEDEYFKVVREGMRQVCTEGTAASTFSDFGIAVAGKTGTAENADHSDNLTFIGFAPYENPEIAVAVVIEYGGKGDAAKETAKAVFEAYFAETLQKEAKNAETTVTEGAE